MRRECDCGASFHSEVDYNDHQKIHQRKTQLLPTKRPLFREDREKDEDYNSDYDQHTTNWNFFKNKDQIVKTPGLELEKTLEKQIIPLQNVINEGDHTIEHKEKQMRSSRKFPCPKCDRELSSNQALTKHLLKIIPCDLICRECEQKQKNDRSFTNHMKTKHNYKSTVQKKKEELDDAIEINPVQYNRNGASLIMRVYEFELKIDNAEGVRNMEKIMMCIGQSNADAYLQKLGLEMLRSYSLNPESPQNTFFQLDSPTTCETHIKQNGEWTKKPFVDAFNVIQNYIQEIMNGYMEHGYAALIHVKFQRAKVNKMGLMLVTGIDPLLMKSNDYVSDKQGILIYRGTKASGEGYAKTNKIGDNCLQVRRRDCFDLVKTEKIDDDNEFLQEVAAHKDAIGSQIRKLIIPKEEMRTLLNETREECITNRQNANIIF